MNDKPPFATNALPLNEDRDAARWAREFIAAARGGRFDPLEEGWLISWFANAMMCGEDTYRWRQEAVRSETVTPGAAETLYKNRCLELEAQLAQRTDMHPITTGNLEVQREIADRMGPISPELGPLSATRTTEER